jgi:GNAT superfamily N-acetyltransferase
MSCRRPISSSGLLNRVMEGSARPTDRHARKLVASDRPQVSQMLARAFADDPVMSFMFPDRARRVRKLPSAFDLLLVDNLPLGGCDVTMGVETASLWRPPEQVTIPFWVILAHLPAVFRIYGLAGARRALTLLGALERRHPPEPHWYLMVLGTEPSLQGKGYGGVALRHRLAEIDQAHLPAYLEASRPDNVVIYSRFGFRQQGELQIPNGPVIYPMWRAAR